MEQVTKDKISRANLGKKRSEEFKQTCRERALNQFKYGMNAGHKKKISESLKGLKRPPRTYEHRLKLSESLKGRKVWNKGIPLSESYRKKLSECNARYWLHKKRDEKTNRKIKEKRALQIIPIKDTSIEIKIQNYLKELGIEFYTHQYMKEIEHSYQCDILIPSKSLVIECDGTYWHNYPHGTEIGHVRTKELIEKGFKVLRLWENEIKNMDLCKFQEVINKINLTSGNMKNVK